jgi:ABC-type branched-subunit amino acid transport system ATPase component
MKKIELQLNQDYKSFEKGFVTILEGDLIILSGVNGAGKSQLMTLIYGTNRITNTFISSNIKINGTTLRQDEIDFRSFKENISINEIVESSSNTFLSSAENAWQNYYNHGLNVSNPSLNNFIDSSIEAKKIILSKFSEQEFNDRNIKDSDFKKALRDANFIWKAGDKFTNIIGEIFFLHALEINKKMVEVGRDQFNANMLQEAPWAKLNRLFHKLKFGYRFKDNYELIGIEINEQPKLYAIKFDETIDEENSRNLSDLSDGEKTIISICFATLIDNKAYSKKLLLLDELDSVLNPSLIQMFFTVIEEFFLKQDILVILSTHSSATISLSPNYAKFYEVFKPNSTGKRILEVSPNEYSELLIANKKFYDKIADQENRILELEKNISNDQNVLIVTEGKTDWKYFLSALRFFHKNNLFKNIQESYFYKFGSESDVRSGICGTDNINELSESKLKNYLNFLIESRKIDTNYNKIRIGIFDSDTNISLTNDSEKKIYSFKIEPNNISTELLFTDEAIKTLVEGRRLFIGSEFGERNKIHIEDSSLSLGGDSSNTNKAGKRVIIETDVYIRTGESIALSKEGFAKAIFEGKINISEESWNKFRNIFVQISAIIDQDLVVET